MTHADYVYGLHIAGVHTECSADKCDRPGTIDQWHNHDHDGPLACDYEEPCEF